MKLIDVEIKEIKKTKQPIETEKINRILWRYFDLQNALKLLVKTKSIQQINKCYADIENMISNTEIQMVELRGVSAAGNISATSQKIVNAIGDTAHKIGDAVNEKIDGLKKIFVADENSKSE